LACRPRVSIVYSSCRDSCPVNRPCVVSAETPCAVDGGGVTETDRNAHIVNRQPDGRLAAVVPHGQASLIGDVSDGPPVAVLHPVGGSESEPSVIGLGDDHISNTRQIAVGQTHLRRRHEAVDAMITGAAVEFGDQLAGGGEHDRVKSGRSVRKPSGEGILGGFGNVADVDAAVIKVEVERSRVAVAEGE
jgi:hypothetical protein